MKGKRTEPEADAENALPRGIGQPATRALHAAGYTRLEQLVTVTERELLALHGVGPKAVGILRATLHAQGTSFADSGSD